MAKYNDLYVANVYQLIINGVKMVSNQRNNENGVNQYRIA